MISCHARGFCTITVEQGPIKAWFFLLNGELLGVGYHHRNSGIIQRWRLEDTRRRCRGRNNYDWVIAEELPRNEFERKVQILLRQVPFA